MSHMNFSASAPQPATRRRAYNPRGKVSFGYRSLVVNLVLITVVMAAAFAMVWFV
ncbi:MAG TPA: hypothetical protein VHU23_01725 [Rhizomicrobium sp.]|nr:hypothetical protein [Rhizomicrobium sp.]